MATEIHTHPVDLKELIRDIPDFPKPGIVFKDITPILADHDLLTIVIDGLTACGADQKVTKVAGIDARGFIFGSAVAQRLGAGFVPVRKPGKLPAATVEQSYELEYGTDRLEMHRDAVAAGERVLIIDDLIATGGTARATAGLVESAGGKVAGFGFVVELEFLKGREKLEGYDVKSLIRY